MEKTRSSELVVRLRTAGDGHSNPHVWTRHQLFDPLGGGDATQGTLPSLRGRGRKGRSLILTK